MSEVIEQELRSTPTRIAVASGPNLALEIAKEQPTAAVISSTSLETARIVAVDRDQHRYFRIVRQHRRDRHRVRRRAQEPHRRRDRHRRRRRLRREHQGVDHHARARRDDRLRGRARRAAPRRSPGLAGLGDLIATCESSLSRNNTAGRLLGQGYSFSGCREADEPDRGGARVGRARCSSSRSRSGVEMPIVEQVAEVLAGTLNPRDIAPHLTTDDDSPQGERTTEWTGQRWSRCSLAVGPCEHIDQLRDGGRGALARSTASATT